MGMTTAPTKQIDFDPILTEENELLKKFIIATEDADPDANYANIAIVKSNMAPGSCWGRSGNNYFGIDQYQHRLNSAIYRANTDSSGKIYFTAMNVSTDELLTLPDTASDAVIGSIEHFWNSKEVFNAMGFLWKRGYLLYGPPGSGKTSTIQQICKSMINKDGIVFYCSNPRIDIIALTILRNIEPNRPIVVIMEDIDSIIDQNGEADLLSLLDGEVQIDNVVYIATTNYPEKLDKRIINRPSRFDFIQKIDVPSAEARKIFISTKNPNIKDNAMLQLWVNQTKSFSIAHIKELIVSVECLGNDFAESIKRLKKMNEQKVSSDDSGNAVGFLGRD